MIPLAVLALSRDRVAALFVLACSAAVAIVGHGVMLVALMSLALG